MISKIIPMFFLFTIFYFLTYIINPLLFLLDKNIEIVLIDINPSSEAFIWTIILSLFLWFLIYIGYKYNPNQSFYRSKHSGVHTNRLRVLTVFSILIFFIIYYSQLQIFLHSMERINVFELSDGNGIMMQFQGLFAVCFIFYTAYFISTQKASKTDIFLYLILIGLLLFASIFLATRRYMAYVILALLLIYIIKRKSFLSKILMILALVSLPISTIILQTIRYMSQNFSFMMIADSLLDTNQLIVSTYEGHWLTLYLQKTDWIHLLFGINPLEPFGNLLSYFPRFLWESKPYNFGILEIQSYLVPASFDNGKPTITLPSTVIVEMLYSYGILVTCFIVFYLGVLLRFVENIFTHNKNNFLLLFLAVYTYLNMFNVIRGGVSFLSGLIVPMLFLLLIKREIYFKKGEKKWILKNG